MDANRVRHGAHDTGAADERQYIRLRYSTQFTTGGRAHTIEMEVPVPLGASPELRDQLIREAEANMEQLYRRVEARARGQRPPESAQRPAPPSPQPTQPAPSQQPQPYQPAQPARSTSPDQRTQPPQSAPAASPAPAAASVREGPSAISLTDRRAGASSTSSASSAASAQQSQARPELPSVPGLASMGGGTMKLSEFIQIIRENWGLAPKEAMELLQVKSLNNMNYRDLLRQLETLVAQASESSASLNNRPASSDTPAQPGSFSPARPPMPAPSPAPRPATPRREQAPSSRPSAPSSPSSLPSRMEGPANIPVYPLRENIVREPAGVYKFDEEEEDDDEEMEIEVQEEGSMSEAMARIKIDELRDMRGTVAPNPGRLVVLHNLLDSQISDDQFLQLIERLWSAVSDKKLKQDQVEGLISWAKEDYFEDEVRAVLSVLNEQA